MSRARTETVTAHSQRAAVSVQLVLGRQSSSIVRRTEVPMRNHIDEALSRAIIREIGERLRASLKEDELPASLKAQLERLDQLDDQSLPSIVPELEIDEEDHAVDYASQ